MVIATPVFLFPFEQIRIKKLIIKNPTNIQTSKKRMDRQNSKTNGKSNIKQTVTHKNSHTHTKENNKRRKKRKGNPKQRGIKPTNKLINENKHYKTD